MAQLAVHLVGDRAWMQRHGKAPLQLDNWNHIDRDEMRAEAWAVQAHIVFGSADPGRAHLVDQSQEGAVAWQEIAQWATDEACRTGTKKLLGCIVEHAQTVFTVDKQDWSRQSIEHDTGGGRIADALQA